LHRDRLALLHETAARVPARVIVASNERVSAGVAGSVETTNAQRNLVGARDALIQARVSLDIARVNSYRALGIIVPAGQ